MKTNPDTIQRFCAWWKATITKNWLKDNGGKYDIAYVVNAYIDAYNNELEWAVLRSLSSYKRPGEVVCKEDSTELINNLMASIKKTK